MPTLQHNGASIYYEEYGTGFPLLVFAPGSLFSAIDVWRRPTGWFDPTKALADEFRVIALDLRNAGQSWAPITPQSGWADFTADHVGLLDHLGIERAHLLGQCIGGPLIMHLACSHPERVQSAVVLQSIGRNGPLPATKSALFQEWCAGLKNHPEATPDVLDAFYANLYTPEFVYAVTREQAAACQTPMLMYPGNDGPHPYAIGEELAQLVPNAEFHPDWKEEPAKSAALQRIRAFLREHTPAR